MIDWRAWVVALLVVAVQVVVRAYAADTNWNDVDVRVQGAVYRVNAAICVKLKNNQFAELSDLSPAKHYPVFITTSQNRGFRVVGAGSCFAASAYKKDGTYFLTNRHVVEFADGMIAECQRFFAAMRLHAERTAGFSSVDDRYAQLVRVVNLSSQKHLTGSDRTMYESTVDSIWETYDNHLSTKADPRRTEFNRCLAAIGMQGFSGFFIHPPGSSKQATMIARVYREAAADMEPDLALLFVQGSVLPSLQLEHELPISGEIVQAVGYPVDKQEGVAVPATYEPAFTAGRVKHVVARLVQFEAPVSKGDSGGPLINSKGRVIGVVVRRALMGEDLEIQGKETTSTQFAAAVTVPAVMHFAPELFVPQSHPAPARSGRAR